LKAALFYLVAIMVIYIEPYWSRDGIRFTVAVETQPGGFRTSDLLSPPKAYVAYRILGKSRAEARQLIVQAILRALRRPRCYS